MSIYLRRLQICVIVQLLICHLIQPTIDQADIGVTLASKTCRGNGQWAFWVRENIASYLRDWRQVQSSSPTACRCATHHEGSNMHVWRRQCACGRLTRAGVTKCVQVSVCVCCRWCMRVAFWWESVAAETWERWNACKLKAKTIWAHTHTHTHTHAYAHLWCMVTHQSV